MTNILIWFFLIAQVFFNTLVNHFVNALSFLAVAWHATYDVTPTLHIAQGGTMSRVAVIIEYEVKSEHRSALEALVREHGTYSLEAEEGCLAFEVMVKKDDPLRMFLFECYADEEAFALHNASPRLAETREKFQIMLTNRWVSVCHA